ncbi:hypothetical protein CAPTEDRAFT_187977 [Capitella teleta]|uniref:Uncharacterized protein n=1 Tax=Capitella teleta TaxID=283909 RepID=R7U4V6_CAPTE|nr:hypothetical protein CAPTEDRAFT_187977 [Capitella teleta]|eukprot:ELU01151.1 hypothetical protein CAPTEDRAFT_187977 [Capitella teleta]
MLHSKVHTQHRIQFLKQYDQDARKAVKGQGEPFGDFTMKLNADGAVRRGLLVDTGATSHIITDASKFVKFDTNFISDKHYIELADGTRCKKVALKKGGAQDIFSVKKATEKGVVATFSAQSSTLTSNGVKFNIRQQGGLYFLNVQKMLWNGTEY